MRVISRIVFFSLLITATLFVQRAGAITTALPESSHYEGSVYYGGDSGGQIDFAVYDTLGSNGNEFTASGEFDDAPGVGQYIYAYQIFSYSDNPYTIDFFGVYTIGENSLEAPYDDNIGSVTDSLLDPSEEGVQPDDAYIGSSTNYGGMVASWEFDNGLLIANEHSWFLLLRSNSGWTPGDYTFDRADISQSFPVATSPEPCTLVLLGLGGTMLLVKRRSA